jgi:hypothetical protein
MMNILLGIDDTDIADSRGTGFLSRQLASVLEQKKLGRIQGITRHQLLVHPDIPYTSQNSSACLRVLNSNPDGILSTTEKFLLENCPEGSDAGMCIVNENRVSQDVIDFGFKAKKEVVVISEALEIAEKESITLRGYTGDKLGRIGALAAVGLRASATDGRYIWLKGIEELRDIKPQVFKASELKRLLAVDSIGTADDMLVDDDDRILGTDWIRPVLKNNKVFLIVEKTKNEKNYEWKVAAKDLVRKIS